MTDYTVMFVIAGYSQPTSPQDVMHFDSLPAIAAAMASEQAQAERNGAGYAPPAAFIWKSYHDDVTDMYPDYHLRFNRAGGPVYTAC